MGRHREFNIDDALDAAVKVFWEKGYEGTSYDDLTRATGVKRPGLYATFGNKEALFQKVIERYTQRYLRHMTDALSEPTSRKMAEHVLYGTVRMVTCDPLHRGCLGINGALACSTDAEPIREMLIRCRAQGEARLRQRLEQYQKDGDLPESADCAALARLPGYGELRDFSAGKSRRLPTAAAGGGGTGSGRMAGCARREIAYGSYVSAVWGAGKNVIPRSYLALPVPPAAA